MSYIAEIPYVGWVIPFLVVLGVVVFVHEYGHYIVGRWVGIRAEVFSIGFGKPLFGWTDKRGMRWQVCLLPLGGYVKFAGDMNAASAGADEEAIKKMSARERKGAFHLAPVWKRALTVLAGPMANFLLSILVFTIVAMLAGRAVNDPVIGGVRADANPDLGFRAGDRVVTVDGTYVDTFSALRAALDASHGETVTALVDRGVGEETIEVRYLNPARIDRVHPGSPAADAGMQSGDVVIAIDGAPTPTFNALKDAVVVSEGRTLMLKVLRDGGEIDLAVTPQVIDATNAEGEPEKRPIIGVEISSFGGIEPVIESASLGDALYYGYARTVGIIVATLDFVVEAFAGRADSSQLGGPIQIAKVSGQAAEQGVESFATMIALISTSIGLINLFPVPVLDGGHLVFYLVEALRGKPLRARWQEIGNGLGFSLILLLMVFATYNDLLR